MSIPRSKSLSFLWRPNRKYSVDDPSPLPLPLHTNPHSLEIPVLANPFDREDKDHPEWAELPVSPTDSSATIVAETGSAAVTDESCKQAPEESTEPPNVQMEPAQTTTLAVAPAATLATARTTSSSSSSTPAQPRARTTPKGPRPRPASMSALGVDGRPRYARPACPANSLPGEIFETRFENPFKPRSRSLNIKREKAAGADVDPSKRRRSLFVIFTSLRQSLIKHKLGGPESEGAPSSPPSESPSSAASSRRTSVSSATGTTLSVGSGSGSTKSRWSFCTRNGVPRTDPYGPPHFAQIPMSNSEGRQSQRRARRG
uniref:Cytochrome P450 33C9 n=1 Tax=Ganoderma boninense TaxID=34458 RepID=A0A5K1K5T2_9APHY|nr:Cytochrome P450 33C9 [Ganoderma boninense]